jgi:hypothetical protein
MQLKTDVPAANAAGHIYIYIASQSFNSSERLLAKARKLEKKYICIYIYKCLYTIGHAQEQLRRLLTSLRALKDRASVKASHLIRTCDYGLLLNTQKMSGS